MQDKVIGIIGLALGVVLIAVVEITEIIKYKNGENKNGQQD